MFYLDGVICTTKKISIKNQTKKVIKSIRLYEKNYIIIFTSRFMGRSNEKVNLAKKKG